MSAQDSNLSNPVRYRKPRADVYTLLLGIALAALIVACIFAYMEIKDYGDQPFSGAPSVAVPVERSATLARSDAPTVGNVFQRRATWYTIRMNS